MSPRAAPRPAHLIRRTAAALVALYDADAPPLTLPQFVVMDCLKRHGPHTAAEMISLTGIDRATLYLMVDGLKAGEQIRLGEAVRSDKSGPKPRLLVLTPKGLRALGAAEPHLWKAEKALLERLTPQQRAQFLDALAVTAHSGPQA